MKPVNWDRVAEAYLAVAHDVLSRLRPDIEAAAVELVACLRGGGKVMVCGNGGSAADAQHFAAELVNRFLLDRAPLAAMALTTDASVLTSVSNDKHFDEVFAKQVRALGRPGDVLVGLSTSGRSPNVLRAFTEASDMGIRTLALTGGGGGVLAETADRLLCVAATGETPRIQEGHGLIIHVLCEMVEAAMAEPVEEEQR